MIYEPAEDSFLVMKYIRDYAVDKKVLDIGTGSGILAREAKKYSRGVVASDINEECRPKGIRFIRSDLFENIHERFDLIIFNPPYLPADEREDAESSLSTAGGKNGHEIIEKFLENAGDHLTPEGKILLVFSSLTGRKKVDDIVYHREFDFKLLESKKIPFEVLYCYLISRR